MRSLRAQSANPPLILLGVTCSLFSQYLSLSVDLVCARIPAQSDKCASPNPTSATRSLCAPSNSFGPAIKQAVCSLPSPQKPSLETLPPTITFTAPTKRDWQRYLLTRPAPTYQEFLVILKSVHPSKSLRFGSSRHPLLRQLFIFLGTTSAYNA